MSRQQAFPLTEPPCSIQDFNRLGKTHPMREGNLLRSVYGFKCESHLKTCSQIHPDVGTNVWAPRGPVKSTHKINYSIGFGQLFHAPPIPHLHGFCGFFSLECLLSSPHVLLICSPNPDGQAPSSGKPPMSLSWISGITGAKMALSPPPG